jgi:hypothetical protein|nr:MAG TPA: hypothetical protein [Caudoviricetes sp.]
MNIRMWYNGITYNVRWDGVYYYWCDENRDKWRKRPSQEAAERERAQAIKENRFEWAKLKITTGLPE